MPKINIEVSERTARIARAMRTLDEMRGRKYVLSHYYQVLIENGAEAESKREAIQAMKNEKD